MNRSLPGLEDRGSVLQVMSSSDRGEGVRADDLF